MKGWSEGVDWESSTGVTALVQSAKCGRVDNVLQLIERGARVDYETKTGYVALVEAARAGYVEVGPRAGCCLSSPRRSGVKFNRTQET